MSASLLYRDQLRISGIKLVECAGNARIDLIARIIAAAVEIIGERYGLGLIENAEALVGVLAEIRRIVERKPSSVIGGIKLRLGHFLGIGVKIIILSVLGKQGTVGYVARIGGDDVGGGKYRYGAAVAVEQHYVAVVAVDHYISHIKLDGGTRDGLLLIGFVKLTALLES
ncbi:unknown [Anaerotruncus sp. CAG:390]|nr:unknown [Anaerotruncus sp. CAG:390]